MTTNGNGPSTQPPRPQTPEESIAELKVLFTELKEALAHSNAIMVKCLNGVQLAELAVCGVEAKGIAHDAQFGDHERRLLALEKNLQTLPAEQPSENA